jgi:uncharacterized membrane protein
MSLAQEYVWHVVGGVVPILVLAIALKIVYKFDDQSRQKRRAIAAIVATATLPIAMVPWAFFLVEERSRAALTWILISGFQVAICIFLAGRLISQMKHDAASYFRPLEGGKSRMSKFSVEGQSSFVVLIWGIYGLAALLGSVFLYFVIAQAWKPDETSFIFKNNEGSMTPKLKSHLLNGRGTLFHQDSANRG